MLYGFTIMCIFTIGVTSGICRFIVLKSSRANLADSSDAAKSFVYHYESEGAGAHRPCVYAELVCKTCRKYGICKFFLLSLDFCGICVVFILFLCLFPLFGGGENLRVSYVRYVGSPVFVRFGAVFAPFEPFLLKRTLWQISLQRANAASERLPYNL